MTIYTYALKELRKKHLKTQEEMAILLHISRSGYNKIENGSQDIDSEALKILAKFFGVSSDYILGIDSTPTQQQLNVYSTVHSSTQSVHSAQDEELIRKFNMLDERDQEDVMDDIDRKLERQERRFAEEGKHA